MGFVEVDWPDGYGGGRSEVWSCVGEGLVEFG
jgi:hypothetical protein